MSMDGAMQSPNVRGGMLLPVGDKAKLDALLARIGEKSGTCKVAYLLIFHPVLKDNVPKPAEAPMSCPIMLPCPTA